MWAPEFRCRILSEDIGFVLHYESDLKGEQRIEVDIVENALSMLVRTWYAPEPGVMFRTS